MKYFLFILISAFCSQLGAQETFRDFINSFPEYSWKDIPEDVRDIKAPKNTIEPKKANIYIYTDKYQVSGFPASNNRIEKSPVRMSGDGKTYFWADEEGQYSNKTTRNLNGKDSTTHYRMYPLARVHINDSICMVFLLYEGPGADEGYGDNQFGTNLYYEAYTFNTVRKKVLSSITLFRDSRQLFTYIQQDRNMYIYQEYYYFINDNGDDRKTMARRTYFLRDDGFFQLTNNEFLHEDKKIAAFTVVDSDGYTNVREQPTTQSRIFYTIKKGLGGILEITDNPNWYKVIYSYEGNDYPHKNAHIKGWIHKSRVCFDSGWYDWKKGDEQVCK